MTDDIDPAAFDRWLVPGLQVLKLGNLQHLDDALPVPVYAVAVAERGGHPVLRIHSTRPVTALTLLHALHDRGMLRPEAYAPVAP